MTMTQIVIENPLAQVHRLNMEGVNIVANTNNNSNEIQTSLSEIAQNKFRKALHIIELILSSTRNNTQMTPQHHQQEPMQQDFVTYNQDEQPCSGTHPDEPNFGTFTQNSQNTTQPDPSKKIPTLLKSHATSLYDEGMTTFSSPDNFMHIQPNHGALRSLIVVAFNLGLSILLSTDNDNNSDGSVAMHYFEKSLSHLCTKESLHDDDDDTRHEENVQIMSKLLHNIAYIHYRNGRYSDALFAYGSALRFMGDHRPGLTAATLNCIGVVQFHTSQKGEGCLSLFRGALDTLRTNDDATKDRMDASVRLPRIATIINNIARAQYMMGDYAQALQSSQEAIAIRRQVYGPNHIDVAAVAFNMGQTYHIMGQLDQALECYQEHLRIARLVLSDRHRDVREVLRHVAQVHYDRDEKEQALCIYDDALRLTRLALGPDHANVAHLLNKRGNVQYELCDLTGALQSYKEGLRIELLTLDSHHANIIVTRGNIARIHKNLGQFEVALSEYKTILQLQRHNIRKQQNHQKKSVGDYVSTATTIYNIGLVWYQMGELEEAFDCFHRALHIRRAAHGIDHLDVASTLNSIGLVLFRQGQVNRAMASFEECLSIRQRLLGREHRDVAVVLFNLATLLFEQGEEEDAIKALLETLRVERAVLGANHPDVLQTVQHIGHLYQGRGDLRTAITYFEESLCLQEKLSQGASQVAKTLNHLGNLHLQLGDTDKVMTYLTRSARLFAEAMETEDDDKNNGTAATGNTQEREDLVICGYELYDMAKVHPECAAVA